MIPKDKPSAVVDFDGTITEFSFPSIGSVKPGAREFLQELRDMGYIIIISSCRNNAELNGLRERTKMVLDMEKFLVANKLPYDWVDGGYYGKPVGDIYIDDRNVPFGSWADMLMYAKERFKYGRNGNGQPKTQEENTDKSQE